MGLKWSKPHANVIFTHYVQMCYVPWSITHNVRELSGFFKDLRGTCLTSRLMALSLPGPDTLAAGIISKRWRNIERSSLDGSEIHTINYNTANTESTEQKADTHRNLFV